MDFESYLNYIEEAILIVDNSLDVISFNRAFERMFPSIKKAVYIAPCLSACPELQKLVQEEGGGAKESRQIPIGGAYYSVYSSEIFDTRGEASVARSYVLSDVTEYEGMLEAMKENNRLLQESNAAVEAQKRDLEKQTRLKEKIAARAETGAILGELHDTLGHSLTVLNALNRLALIEKKSDDRAGRRELEETLRLAKISLTELDTMDFLTIGNGEKTMDITAFLYRLKQTVAGVSLGVRLTITGGEDNRHKRLFYPVSRIVQEATTNCLRHSGATEFSISVNFEETHIRLKMEDNGSSLENSGEIVKGNGLVGMERRTHDYGGEIEVGINEGGGVRILVTIPTKELRP